MLMDVMTVDMLCDKHGDFCPQTIMVIHIYCRLQSWCGILLAFVKEEAILAVLKVCL